MTIPESVSSPPGRHHVSEADWGSVAWLINGETNAGAEQTFGVVTINPGSANPLHLHPNCEEILYVLSGTCDHRIGDDVVQLEPGMVICVPRQTPHRARTTSAEPLVAVISFSSPDRQTINLENGDVA
jgi:mannose-6-phosphate isomerase-like protein (cupin superfamily)